ncbi:cell division topological specificity factor MinE [Maribrevibacterium harenarium]|uniref:Cell division topological specificity factor n=1 Tax=Maribrevibacterium harenarium TaxID=2589817 RepID=A0A501WXW1_9GAMM|nr:cell division topological specificity factor MinE [Maribrevibacterium harenarium]TPE52307.1 cell division topological specificity factor MinE [Maribrevibacterium harenarium]
MGLFDYFKRKGEPTSATVAKDRLQIIVAHERSQRQRPNYVAQMQEEIIAVIRKYVNVDKDAVSIAIDNADDCTILELNVTLPDK